MSRHHIASNMQTRKSKAAPRVRRLSHLERPTPSGSLGLESVAADLIIHLFASPQSTAPAGDSSWHAKDSLIYLISDLVSACGGTPSESRDGYLVARFGDSPRALTAAKRIQLALLGFAKHCVKESAWSVIGVQAPYSQNSDSADAKAARAIDWRAILESAQPGQILLAPSIWVRAKSLGEYRLYTLEGGAQVYEFVWAQAEIYEEFRNLLRSSPRREATERDATCAAGRDQSVETPAVSSADDSVPTREQAAFSDSNLQGPEAGREIIRPLAAGAMQAFTSLRRIPKYFWTAAAVAAVIAVFGLAAHLMYRSHHTRTPKGTQAKVQNEVPIQQVQAQMGQHSASDVSSSSLKTPAKSGKAPESSSLSHPPQQDTTSQDVSSRKASPQKSESHGGKCDLNPRQIPDFLEMADQKRARGSYGDAERQYNAVLGCEPGNTRAREGLAKTRAAKALPIPH